MGFKIQNTRLGYMPNCHLSLFTLQPSLKTVSLLKFIAHTNSIILCLLHGFFGRWHAECCLTYFKVYWKRLILFHMGITLWKWTGVLRGKEAEKWMWPEHVSCYVSALVLNAVTSFLSVHVASVLPCSSWAFWVLSFNSHGVYPQ